MKKYIDDQRRGLIVAAMREVDSLRRSRGVKQSVLCSMKSGCKAAFNL